MIETIQHLKSVDKSHQEVLAWTVACRWSRPTNKNHKVLLRSWRIKMSKGEYEASFTSMKFSIVQVRKTLLTLGPDKSSGLDCRD